MTNRLFLACCLAAALGAGPWAARLDAQDTVTVGVGADLSAPLYQSLDVPIFADLRKAGTEKLGSYTVRVSWNTGVLSYNGWGDGAFGRPLVRTDSTGYGVVWVSGISAAGLGGLVDLFRLSLAPVAASADTVRVQVRELSAAGTLRDLLATTTLVLKSGAYCAARGRWGDLDQDDLANSRDALAILSSIVGLPVGIGFDLTLGDVDGDAKVNSRDALILLSYAVGLPIPGQRVLLVAGGACTSGQTPQVTVLPDTADLVVGQSINIMGLAKDASGTPLTITGGSLTSADPTIAVVSDGLITGRQPGATIVTGSLGPGVQVDIPVIVRAKRGTWYVDAQRAQGAVVQLGTQRWPFATPEYAFSLVAEGDTIRVAPGIVDYRGNSCILECFYASDMRAGVVVLGDTLADGTRPVLRAAEGDGLTAFPWTGGVHGELRNLVLEGFYRAALLGGLKALLVENVRIKEPGTAWGYGLYASTFVDTLRVRRSELLADTSGYQSYHGLYVGNGAAYVEVSDSKLWYWGDGAIYGYDVDSLDVVRNDLSYTDYAGVYVRNSTRGLNARISGNRMIDNYYEGVSVDGAGRVALDHNYIYERDDDGIQIYGLMPGTGITTGTKVTSLGDSIKFRADDWDWINLQDVDSVRVDSLWLENPADTAMWQYGYVYANYARMTNSKLLNLYLQGLQFNGRELVVDNSHFTGCAVCNWNSGYALEAYAGNDSGPRVRVTNSTFFNLRYGVYASSANTAAGPMVVANNSFDSLGTALYLYGDSLAITDNTFANVRNEALVGKPSYTLGRPFVEAQVLRNQVACAVVSGYTSYGLVGHDGPARFENNAVRKCRYGLYAYNVSYPTATVIFRGDTVLPDSTSYYRVGIRPNGKWQATIVRNRIVGGYYGIDLTTSDTTVTAVIDSNAVSGTGMAAVDIYYVYGPVTGTGNNIQNNLQYGVYDPSGRAGHSFTQGAFVGNATWAVYASAGNFAFDASNNWWGAATGPHTPGADSVTGTVTTTPYLAADNTGSLPALAPRLLAAAPAPVPRAPLAPSRPAGLDAAAAAPDHRVELARRNTERAARRATKDQARTARHPGDTTSRGGTRRY